MKEARDKIREVMKEEPEPSEEQPQEEPVEVETEHKNIVYHDVSEELSQYEQGMILKDYLKENDISANALGKQLGIPKQTILAKIKWTKISKTEVARLEAEGWTKKEIHRSILSDKDKDIAQDHLICKIHEFHELVRSCLHDNKFSPQTLVLLDALVNDINRLRMRIERMR